MCPSDRGQVTVGYGFADSRHQDAYADEVDHYALYGKPNNGSQKHAVGGSERHAVSQARREQ
eukprot:CAMPEP_0178478958 /NCGR_PEP_ID=MMETSP0696-20121128/4931_1 /TAXON_ID=265572 /ORGANISM="Extubocellulus spinifer, Strain CCMP396" /LENGTH=61 /DNA_ID=CAMNT_0020106349 /DNA_START=520 /DNA_END=705 /DNA_ORIENTATION=+